jgi:hypothetical protein
MPIARLSAGTLLIVATAPDLGSARCELSEIPDRIVGAVRDNADMIAVN